MKTSIKYMLLTCVVVFTVGCTANYRPADGAPVAKLLFTTNKGPGMFVGLWTIQTEKCPTISKVCLLTDGQTNKKDALVEIDAGKPFVVKAQLVNILTGTKCNDAGVFTPMPGATYRLKHTITPQGCWLELFKGDSAIKDPSFRQLVSVEEKDICSEFITMKPRS
ncbi:MAG: hypothetical protein NTW42_01805 [Deltaproteobacteria bacterium]|nr:hypothetical protein [Deltaproteobacteria bacterium]